ncbi:uncharacterized protein LOC124860528 [Girardinichthys multiradiatus]|uniref:uncharacterized protein LOC124860528 n=1 Tax=Girardinichthys multiradiatus TaxID=208333 RepID=UPI001FABF59F|nr:uncharacterized protein LOC124860528 [Girardinichthys multiradiatus]
MEATVGLLFLLIGVSYGVETFCDARQDGAQCLGSWGGTVFVKLMDQASGAPRMDWMKGATLILRWRNNEIVANTIMSRSEFIPNNGTFRINNLRNSDSGKYTLNLFDSEGKEKRTRNLQLFVEGQSPIRVGAISALVFYLILLLVCIIILCVRSKKQKCKENLNADLIYVDVRVVQQQGRKSVKQNMEEEVEYSQIKTAGRNDVMPKSKTTLK